MGFSLERFEYLAYTRQHEIAARELMVLLSALDANYGLMGEDFIAKPVASVHPQEVGEHVLARISSAVSCLFSDASFQFSPVGHGQILNWHRWLSSLFSASQLRNADHVIRALNLRGEEDLGNVEIADKDLIKFCMLFSPESEIPLDLDAMWEHNKVLTAGLCLVLMSPRFLGSPVAHDKREKILPWLSRKLPEIDDLSVLPAGILHDVYMHCSYADQPEKHDIKRAINILIRRKLHEAGLFALPPTDGMPAGSKPVMLVIVEWFTATHSIYRTHSRTIESARDLFHVIGMGYEHSVDEAGRAIFDEFIPIEKGDMLAQLQQIQATAKEKKAEVMYMPSVGMFPITLYLSNMRLAPLQAMALGHPATTHSPEMDYVVVEEDYVGDPACFSETLLQLPVDGMPYRPSSEAAAFVVDTVYREKPDLVRIVIAATTMKLNPLFLSTLAEILHASPVKIHYHLLIGQAQGLMLPQIKRVISQFLGDRATVYPHQSYKDYLKVMADCDMFVNPFPFGNTNGIIDTVTAGLVGICKTGREVHEHIDEGLFGRLGFPSWTVAHTREEYIAATLRMASQHAERTALRKELANPAAVQKLFHGRPEIMGRMLLNALTSRFLQLA
ncbi:peptide transporter [Herbaspirillum sp. RTI4]|uniref:peptide transporter n=1 Tax=Herbaspirillum sp. RTI4 TaxID=3048640 RepID=UPI002AB47D5C|nr:peptide transporter [Herbaspirillum sp. RTI4]MDY7576938.1 peptide transporter [Herbaspirillum sp. RTI4]MEA9983582.1 peptide transporter [Herbaspirillum sp. RTI4]